MGPLFLWRNKMQLIRGTTPTIDCIIPDNIDVSDAKEIWFTIKQGGRIIADRKLSDKSVAVDGQGLSITLTQKETLEFNTFEVGECGIRIILNDETAWALEEIEPVYVSNVVKGGVIGEE